MTGRLSVTERLLPQSASASPEVCLHRLFLGLVPEPNTDFRNCPKLLPFAQKKGLSPNGTGPEWHRARPRYRPRLIIQQVKQTFVQPFAKQ